MIFPMSRKAFAARSRMKAAKHGKPLMPKEESLESAAQLRKKLKLRAHQQIQQAEKREENAQGDKPRK